MKKTTSRARKTGQNSPCCSECGQPLSNKYKHIKKGTRVRHTVKGWIGHVFSYEACAPGTCGVDFGKHGQWCEHFRFLQVIAPKKSNLQRVHEISLTPAQRKLAKKHGTPAEFAVAVYKCVPGDISMAEAKKAIDAYTEDWTAAA